MLAGGLSWLAGLAALSLIVRDPLLSRPSVLGGSIGPLALPMAAFTSIAMIAVAAIACQFSLLRLAVPGARRAGTAKRNKEN